MPTVLSIQSWVACGNVGNAAALFPLQRLGCETWSLNTVALSNHTGYEKWRGDIVPAREIACLFEGIAELGVLPRCDAVLSGYLGEADTGPVLLDIVARVKAANPRALFCCDPVMGDIGLGYYVRDGIPEFFRDRALAFADILTPNRFELESLTGDAVTSLAEAGRAVEVLRRRGPGIVLATSLDSAGDQVAAVAAGPDGVWAARDAASADRSNRLRRRGGCPFSRLAAQGPVGPRGALSHDRRDLRGDRGDDASGRRRTGARRGPGRAGRAEPTDPCTALVETAVSFLRVSGSPEIHTRHAFHATRACRRSRRNRRKCSHRWRFPTGSCRRRWG